MIIVIYLCVADRKGKWFLDSYYSTASSTYKIRSSYIDYSSKNGDAYSVNYDIKNLDLSTLRLKIDGRDGNIIIYKYHEKIKSF
jgi:hypothetical protein